MKLVGESFINSEKPNSIINKFCNNLPINN